MLGIEAHFLSVQVGITERVWLGDNSQTPPLTIESGDEMKGWCWFVQAQSVPLHKPGSSGDKWQNESIYQTEVLGVVVQSAALLPSVLTKVDIWPLVFDLWHCINWLWWYTPGMAALKMRTQEKLHSKSKASLGYMRPWLFVCLFVHLF